MLILAYRFLLSTSMVTIPANNDNIIMMIATIITTTIVVTGTEPAALGLTIN